MEQPYPEPFAQALSYSSQRAAELTSLFITLTQAYTQHRTRQQHRQALRDQRVATELARQEHAARATGIAGGAPLTFVTRKSWACHAEVVGPGTTPPNPRAALSCHG